MNMIRIALWDDRTGIGGSDIVIRGKGIVFEYSLSQRRLFR
jgi:hypothetical protein